MAPVYNKRLYYLDTNVLLKYTLLLKFVQNYCIPGHEWRIFHIFTGEDIDDVISLISRLLLALFNTSVYMIKKSTR